MAPAPQAELRFFWWSEKVRSADDNGQTFWEGPETRRVPRGGKAEDRRAARAQETSQFLAEQKIPPALVTKRIWDERFQDIRYFERYLGRNGIVVLKFFLHVSKKEQKQRFLERAEDPEKNWKFRVGHGET